MLYGILSQSHLAYNHTLSQLQERLATMYMMKLRYGDDFGHRANSLWRVLFVLCLMPWMRKYRLRPLPTLEDLDEQIEEAQAELAAEGEDGGAPSSSPVQTLQRAATQRRLESMQNLKSLRTIGTGANREELLEKEVTILRERNQQLLAQVKQLGGNPAASRRNLMSSFTNNDNLATVGAFPDRRSGNGASTACYQSVESHSRRIQRYGRSRSSVQGRFRGIYGKHEGGNSQARDWCFSVDQQSSRWPRAKVHHFVKQNGSKEYVLI